MFSGEFSCNKIGTLIAHKMIHNDLKPFSCPECEFKSRTKANLTVHLKTHNSEKPYRCNNAFKIDCRKHVYDFFLMLII